jgi:hypothetical protein
VREVSGLYGWLWFALELYNLETFCDFGGLIVQDMRPGCGLLTLELNDLVVAQFDALERRDLVSSLAINGHHLAVIQVHNLHPRVWD